MADRWKFAIVWATGYVTHAIVVAIHGETLLLASVLTAAMVAPILAILRPA